jgi:hypothetical protein
MKKTRLGGWADCGSELGYVAGSYEHDAATLVSIKMREISSVTEEILTSKEGLCSMQFVANSVFFRHEIDI